MPLLQVSGFPAGPPTTITHPLVGRPWADVVLGVTEVPWQPGDQVVLKFETAVPVPEYRMTVERVGQRGGFAAARLVGGTGGLGRDIGPKFYKDIPVETVVREILQECGEQVGDLNLPGTLPTWTRPAGPAHEALRAIMMRYPFHIWWMDAAGKVYADTPKWEPFGADLPLSSYDAAQGLYTTALTPALTANRHVTLTRGEEKVEKRAARVTHEIADVEDYQRGKRTELRTRIQVGDGKDSGVHGLETLTQAATRWTDYCALYPCKVLRDHGNHTLDLRPEHPLMPEMTEVRLLQPIAGAKVKLKAGATVLLEFQAGDPARPVVTGYAAAALERFELVTGRGQGIVIDDDRGQRSPDDAEYFRPYIRVQDAAGQLAELWAEEGKERVKLRDRAGQELLLDATKGAEKVQLKDKSGGSLLMDGVTGDVTLKASGKMTLRAGGTILLDAPGVALAGGQPVARVGDTVAANGVDSLGGAIHVDGTITSGSTKVGAG